jgi:hypothetical protein
MGKKAAKGTKKHNQNKLFWLYHQRSATTPGRMALIRY